MASPGSSASAPSDRAALAEQNEDGLLASSFFPAPPTIYKSFTLRHLELARLVVDAQPRRDEPWAQANQDAILETLSCEERPDIDLRELVEPPNVEWIQEQGGYDAFASEWPVRRASLRSHADTLTSDSSTSTSLRS
jgi:mediator of RNA polymerase II transcription subunit 7